MELGDFDVEIEEEQGDEKTRQPRCSGPMDDGRPTVSQMTEADGSVSGESGEGRRRMDSNRNYRPMTSARLAGRNNDLVVGW